MQLATPEPVLGLAPGPAFEKKALAMNPSWLWQMLVNAKTAKVLGFAISAAVATDAATGFQFGPLLTAIVGAVSSILVVLIAKMWESRKSANEVRSDSFVKLADLNVRERTELHNQMMAVHAEGMKILESQNIGLKADLDRANQRIRELELRIEPDR